MKLLVVIALSALLSACATPPKPQPNAYERYQIAMGAGGQTPNYVLARAELEGMISTPDIEVGLQRLSIELLASNLVSGRFNYYDEDDVIYWANKMDGEFSEDIDGVYQSLVKVREFRDSEPNQVIRLNSGFAEECDASIVHDRRYDDNLSALRLLNKGSCVQNFLGLDPAARAWMSDLYRVSATTDRERRNARGLALYEINESDYDGLDPDDLNALTWARILVLDASIDRDFDLGLKVQDSAVGIGLFTQLMAHAEGYEKKSLEGQQKFRGIVDQILNDERRNETDEGLVLSLALAKFVAAEDLESFEAYYPLLMNSPVITVEAVNFWMFTRLVLIAEYGDTRQALTEADEFLQSEGLL